MFVSVYLVLSFLLIILCFFLLIVFFSPDCFVFLFFFVICVKDADATFIY